MFAYSGPSYPDKTIFEDFAMPLSRTERLVLANQYRILELLDTDSADAYKWLRGVVENGYERHYDELMSLIESEPLSAEECQEIVNVMDMFRLLKHAYEHIEDKSGIENWEIEFAGYDGNYEAAQMSYAGFFCKRGPYDSRFEELKVHTSGFNSHCPCVDRYRRMLGAYIKLNSPSDLDRDALLKIVQAGRS